jgi:hypothetical protein
VIEPHRGLWYLAGRRQLVKPALHVQLLEFLVCKIQNGLPVHVIHPVLAGPEVNAQVIRCAKEGIDWLCAQIGLDCRELALPY